MNNYYYYVINLLHMPRLTPNKTLLWDKSKSKPLVDYWHLNSYIKPLKDYTFNYNYTDYFFQQTSINFLLQK